MEHTYRPAATWTADFIFWVLYWRSIRREGFWGRSIRDIIRESRILSRILAREVR